MTWIILLFLIIVIVFFKVVASKRGSGINFSSYRKRERLMNESEHALFINLQKTFRDEYIILSKVRIEDFVEVNRNEVSDHKDRWGLRNRIKSRHVDFLICDRSTTEPLLALELDGKSHNNAARQDRDKTIDDLYNAIGLPIEHIPVGVDFAELMQDIKIC